jgi:hypothetical protein
MLFTTIAASARTASRNSRTASRRPVKLSPLSGQRLPPAPVWLCLQPGQPVSPATASAAVALGSNRNSAHTSLQNRRSRAPDRPMHPRPPSHRLAVAISIPRPRLVF